MNGTLSLKEIDQILNDNTESVIWTQNIRSSVTLVRKILQLIAFIGFIIFLLVVAFSDNTDKSSFGFDSITILATYGMALVYEFTNTYIFATLEYSIYPKFISFEWGLFSRKRVDIPFSDITAINLVQYTDSKFSTIHFGTNNVYNIKKFDFDNNDTRPHITFERVKDGVKVHELLSYLQKMAKT